MLNNWLRSVNWGHNWLRNFFWCRFQVFNNWLRGNNWTLNWLRNFFWGRLQVLNNWIGSSYFYLNRHIFWNHFIRNIYWLSWLLSNQLCSIILCFHFRIPSRGFFKTWKIFNIGRGFRVGWFYNLVLLWLCWRY